MDVAMIRMNHKGRSMDAEDYATQGLGNVREVVEHVKEVRKEGMGVISMKLIGEGTFNREDREKAMRFAFREAGVDCVRRSQHRRIGLGTLGIQGRGISGCAPGCIVLDSATIYAKFQPVFQRA